MTDFAGEAKPAFPPCHLPPTFLPFWCLTPSFRFLPCILLQDSCFLFSRCFLSRGCYTFTLVLGFCAQMWIRHLLLTLRSLTAEPCRRKTGSPWGNMMHIHWRTENTFWPQRGDWRRCWKSRSPQGEYLAHNRSFIEERPRAIQKYPYFIEGEINIL